MKKFLTSLALALLAVFSVLPCAYAEEYVPLGSYTAGEKLNCYISNVDAGAQVVSLDLPRGCSLVDDFNGGTRRLLLGGAPTEAGQHAFSIQVSGVENYTINCSIDLTPALPSIQTCQDVTCAPGSSVLLSVSAWTTDGGSLSYQWYTGVGFTSIPIEGDEQLLSTVSYIHHNPAKAGYGLDVKWSSYRDYIGTGECLVTSTEFVLEVFGSVDEFVRFHALQQEDDQAGIPRSRIPESQALEVAKTVLGRLSPYDVKAQGKEQRNACIVALYNAGLSARQISRITSIGTGIIYRAIK